MSMPTPIQPTEALLTRAVVRIPYWAGSGLLLLAVSVLAGWVLDIDALRSFHPSLVLMKANTAVEFALIGAWFLLLSRRVPERSRRTLRTMSALAVMAIGGLTLLEYASDFNLGIDQLLFDDTGSGAGTGTPGRMSLITASCFVLLGIAMSMRASGEPLSTASARLADALAIAVLAAAFVALVGYFYGADELYGLGLETHIAVHAVIGLVLAGVGLLALSQSSGLIGLLLDDGPGGRALRVLLPASIGLPLILGGIRLWGQHRGLYDTELGHAFFSSSICATFAALVVWSAAGLRRQDRGRRVVEVALRQVQEELEDRVAIRTGDLARALESLRGEGAERERISAALRRSEGLYRTLAKNLPGSAVFLFDRDRHYLVADGEELFRTMGLSREALEGKTMEEVASPGNRATAKVMFEAVLAGERRTVEMPRGSLLLSCTAVPVRDETGAVVAGQMLVTDITESRAMEQRAIAGEARYRALADAALEGIALADGETIEQGNAALGQMFGREASDLLGRSMLDFMAAPSHDAMRKALAEGDGSTRELMGLRRTGEPFPVEMRVRPVDLKGRYLRAVALVDLEPRRHAEESAKKSDALFRGVLEATPEIVFAYRDNRFVFANPACVKAFGCKTEAELIGTDIIETVHPQSRQEVGERMQEVIGSELPIEVSGVRTIGRDGREGLLEAIGLLLELDGEKTVFVLARDITERRAAEAALAEINSFWRAIIDSANYSIIATNPEGIVREFNPGAERMLGYRAGEVVGNRTPVLVHDWDEIVARAAVLSHELGTAIEPGFEVFVGKSRRGVADENEWTYVRKDGTRLPVRLSVTAMRDRAGLITGFLGIAHDLTEQRQTRDELLRAKHVAEAAMRARADFLARMSHEIRTPMNGVLGMLELTLGTRLTPQQIDYLDTARSSAQSLLAVINDILDFSKIDARKLRLSSVEFGMRDAFGAVLKGLARSAHEKDLELVLQISAAMPDRIIGDPQRLQQILINLVSNAIKFTPRGEVTVSVHEVAVRPASVAFEIVVADTGIGIPADKQLSIFDAFSQADEETTRRFGGTGLGLAICAQLVAMMGGTIRLESAPGRGTRFSVALDLPHSGERPFVSPDSLLGLRVLIIDDHASQREALLELLAGWRMQPTAADGAGARVAWRDPAREGTPFALVLADVATLDGMTVQGGHGIEKENLGAVPLIALTRAVIDHDAGRRTWHADAEVGKPIIASVLLETIEALLAHPGRLRASFARDVPVSISVRPLRVLLAEDNRINQRVAAGLLERAGHVVTVVETGRSALEALARGTFDIVLMDVQMPEMDGIEATRALRASEREAGGHVPVVALTAQAMSGDRERCLAAGADGYIAKPIDAQGLFDVIHQVLAENESAAGQKRVERIPPPKTGEEPPYDRPELLERLGGDEDLLAQLVITLLVEMPRLLAELTETVQRGDAEAIVRAAHGLRGAMANISAHTAAALALELEQSAYQHQLGRARDILVPLTDQIARLGRAFGRREEVLSA